ncbi:hypothetical protein ACHAWF_015273 [Thalassiosira exigua]
MTASSTPPGARAATLAAALLLLSSASSAFSFSPPRPSGTTHVGAATTAPPPAAAAVRPARPTKTRLAYKHRDDDGGDSSSSDDDETNEAIFYDDLDGASSSEPSSPEDDLVRELGDAIRRNRLDGAVGRAEGTAAPGGAPASPLGARSDAPRKARTSSAGRTIERVPKVEPVHMSTASFLSLVGDPAWPRAPDKEASRAREKKRPTTKEDEDDAEAEAKADPTKAAPKPPPPVESWKTKMEKQDRKPAAFMASNYLDALASNAQGEKKEEASKDDLMKSLRDQRARRRAEQLKAQQQAIVDATRRTNPKDVVEARVAKREGERKRKERAELERLYVERKERIDAKKEEEERRYLKEREEREEKRKAEEREALEAKVAAEVEAEAKAKVQAEEEAARRRAVRRGVPVLDVRPRAGEAGEERAPLLVGSARTVTLTEYQLRAVEVARKYRASASEGRRGGAPIVAIVDGPTPDGAARRFATLAAVEAVGREGGGADAKLTGVGRAFLSHYFSSRDAGLSGEEEAEPIDPADLKLKPEEEEDLPVVVAQFELFSDEATPESGKQEGIAELYRAANRVYRLHEERKKLVAGLQAGAARLRSRKQSKASPIASSFEDLCPPDFEDWDGLGLAYGTIVDVVADEPDDEELSEPSSPAPPRSPLEALENYGLGSYGALSTIPDLAASMSSLLAPYHGPDRRARAEYGAEVASMTAFRALEGYASPDEAARALLATSAARRLELARDIMERHRDELDELAEMIGQELGRCDESGADL